MRIETHGAPATPAHPGAGHCASTARPTEGSRLLASGRLGIVIIAAAKAAEAVVRDAGIPSTLHRGENP